MCATVIIGAVSGCSQNIGTNAEVAVPEKAVFSAPGATTKPSAKKASTIQWEPTMAAALKKARATQKPIMVDFYADWCGPCKMLDEEIYPSAEVSQEAKNFVNLKLDFDVERELVVKYKVEGLPTIIFLDSSGEVLHREMGITGNPSDFVQTMKTALSRIETTPA